MTTYAAFKRRISEAKSFEDLSRVASDFDSAKRLNKVERIMVERFIGERREYLVQVAMTP